MLACAPARNSQAMLAFMHVLSGPTQNQVYRPVGVPKIYDFSFLKGIKKKYRFIYRFETVSGSKKAPQSLQKSLIFEFGCGVLCRVCC